MTVATADLTDDESSADPIDHVTPLSQCLDQVPDRIQLKGGDETEDDASSIGDVTMANEIYNEFGPDKPSDSEHRIIAIEKHRYKDAALQLRVLYDTDESQWEYFRDLKEDISRILLTYMVENNVSQSKRDSKLQWAKKTVRDLNRACRRIALLYDLCIDDNDHVYRVRRAIKGSTKKRKKNVDYSSSECKCGVEIPTSV